MSCSRSVRPTQAPCGVGVAGAAGGGAGTVRGRATPRGDSLRDAPVPVPPSREQRGIGMADDWPLRTYLELGALPSAVPCARLHAKQLLWEWGIAEFSNNAELLVSELVTNALKASQATRRSMPIRLWVLSDKVQVVILVWDDNPHPPVRADTSEEAESGRGLILVEALSDKWSWYAHEGLGGKVVWCQVSLDPAQRTSDHDPREGR
jgi:anti-sigma regulatory factor (Ser/Thr protein kinase)